MDTLVDLLRLLNRDDLEGSQLVNRKFVRASEAIFKSGDLNVPLRRIECVTMLKRKLDDTTHLFAMEAKSSVERGVCSLRGMATVEDLARVMRCSKVEQVTVTGKDFGVKRICS